MTTVFEKLLSGEWPCAMVYEDDRVFAFMDAGQVNDGHVIVATKRPFKPCWTWTRTLLPR